MTVTRWPGKPTSGRYVYPKRGNDMKQVPGWNWQCDLHDDDWEAVEPWGSEDTMQEAFAAALAHADLCGRSNTEES